MAESRGQDRDQYEDSEWNVGVELVSLSTPIVVDSLTPAAFTTVAASSEVSTKFEEVKIDCNGSGKAKAFKRPDMIVPCARCNSMETKFCYFNNCNENQPRHFCQACQRYWTVGGAVKDVPEGTGRLWNKQSSIHHDATKPANGDVPDIPCRRSHVAKPPVVPGAAEDNEAAANPGSEAAPCKCVSTEHETKELKNTTIGLASLGLDNKKEEKSCLSSTVAPDS